MITSRMFDYAHFLPGFNYKIEYINTENHGIVEYLYSCTTKIETSKRSRNKTTSSNSDEW